MSVKLVAMSTNNITPIAPTNASTAFGAREFCGFVKK